MARRQVGHLGRYNRRHRRGVQPCYYFHHSRRSGRGRSRTQDGEIHSLDAPPSFCAIAIETFGPICEEGQLFIREIGRRTTTITCDPRETSFLSQRLSSAIQRFNTVCFAGSFQSNSEASHT